MPTYLVTADTDLTTRGKRLASWHPPTGSAGVINLRNGSVSGDIVVPINIPVNSDGQSYEAWAGCRCSRPVCSSMSSQGRSSAP